jgi:hypothetical protein
MSRSSEKTTHENNELVDTVKALIALYKSAFGDEWRNIYLATVHVSLN